MKCFKKKLLAVHLIIDFLVISFLITSPALAKDYQWKVLEVTDGDTLKVQIEGFPEELANHLSVRVLGIDTPEKNFRANCPEENNLGHDATDYTKSLVSNGKVIIFNNIKWDKYGGRILATVTIDGKNLGDELIKAKLAREYHGDKKKSWCK